MARQAWQYAHAASEVDPAFPLDADPLMDENYPGGFAALAAEEPQPQRGASRGTRATIHGKSIPTYNLAQNRLLGWREDLHSEQVSCACGMCARRAGNAPCQYHVSVCYVP